LKFVFNSNIFLSVASPSAWRVWIEI